MTDVLDLLRADVHDVKVALGPLVRTVASLEETVRHLDKRVTRLEERATAKEYEPPSRDPNQRRIQKNTHLYDGCCRSTSALTSAASRAHSLNQGYLRPTTMATSLDQLPRSTGSSATRCSSSAHPGRQEVRLSPTAAR